MATPIGKTSNLNTATAITTAGFQAQGTAAVVWPAPTVVNGCVNVTDNQVGVLGTTCAAKTFTYTKTYTVRCGTGTVVNTATFTTNTTGTTGSASSTVNYTSRCLLWRSGLVPGPEPARLAGSAYDPAPYLGAPVPGFPQYTIGYALANPSIVKGPAFNAAANYLATIFFGSLAGTQATGENCPIDAFGNLKPTPEV